MIDQSRIDETMRKMDYYLSRHNSICVGVSGGSDSNVIVHIIATSFRQYLPKVHFVFENTGLEYRATLRHLDFMESRYNINIDRVKPERGNDVVSVCRREGVPILSKMYSKTISAASRGFPGSLHKLEMTRKESPRFALSQNQKDLAHYLIDNDIKVSAACCELSKKKPHVAYSKQINADLQISGERKAEGGARATAHTSCFEFGKTYDKYMPLFFWDDETKQYYKEKEGIVYSDCYEVYGLKRTGCVGCPFSSRAGEELKVMQKYEPKLYKACMHVFGESYRLMDKFSIHRHKIFDDQLSFFD